MASAMRCVSSFFLTALPRICEASISSDVAHAGDVVDAAKSKDEVALQIVADGGTELGHAAVAVIRNLQMERERFQIAYVGGVFRSAGDLMLDPLRAGHVGIALELLRLAGPVVPAAEPERPAAGHSTAAHRPRPPGRPAGRSPPGPRTRPAARPRCLGGVAAGPAGGPAPAGSDGRGPGRWPPLLGGGAAGAPAGGPGRPCGSGSRPGRCAGQAGRAGSSPPPAIMVVSNLLGRGYGTTLVVGSPVRLPAITGGGPWRSSTP